MHVHAWSHFLLLSFPDDSWPIKVCAEREVMHWMTLNSSSQEECVVFQSVTRGGWRCGFHYVRLNARPRDRLCLHQHSDPPCLRFLGSDPQECLLYSGVHASSCYRHLAFQHHFWKHEACIYHAFLIIFVFNLKSLMHDKGSFNNYYFILFLCINTRMWVIILIINILNC